MISEYQESEEMRSNSLDVKLKKTEEELRQQEQEIADQQQLLELTVKDLEINQASLEIANKEIQQLKNKVNHLKTLDTCIYWYCIGIRIDQSDYREAGGLGQNESRECTREKGTEKTTE